jgi:hypothetical protein
LASLSIETKLNNDLVMTMNFIEYPWHDAILKEINIDRSNSGKDDVINIVIIWSTGLESSFSFKDVYYAQLNLNFGIIAEECISEVAFIPKSDIDVINFIHKWKHLVDDIENLMFIEIKTISTGSSIKIFARNVSSE